MTPDERVRLNLDTQVTLRPAERADLPLLEWFGEYRHFRVVFQRAFAEQVKGNRLMLLADCAGFPVGQVFLHYRTGERPSLGPRVYMYSLRVLEMFRGHGIGTALIHQAERCGLDTGHAWASIAVARDNPGALRLYERLGYQIYAEDAGRWTYIDHRGRLRRVNEPCWLLEKRIQIG